MQTASASVFDPSALLDTEYSGDLNTRLTPIPEGGPYLAHISKIDVREVTTRKTQEVRHVADFTFVIDDEGVKALTQLAEPQSRMSVFLDLKPGTNQLLTKEDSANANVRLGRLKEACGLKAGRRWSLRQLEGLSCYVRIKQRTDENDIEIIYSDVVAVAKDPGQLRTRRE